MSNLHAGGEFWRGPAADTAVADHYQLHGDPALSTAQILTDFQQTPTARRPAASCDDGACRAQAAAPPCFDECELPFTAECTDSCVVVCEEPHGDICCEPTTVCQSSDCQYSSLDRACCTDCPDEYAVAGKAGGFFNHGAYGQAHDFAFHQGVPNYHAAPHMSSDCHWPSGCSVDYSQCSMPCPVNSCDPYSMTPPSTITQSSAGSPWSLQSPATSLRGSQSYQSHWFDGDNRLGVLASSVDEDGALSRHYSGSIGHHGPSHSADLDILNSVLEAQFKMPAKHRHSVSAQSFGDVSADGSAGRYQVGGLSELHCRWLVREGDAQHMCLHRFESREALHAHILDEHVKALKKKSAAAEPVHPICCWHGCESARRKKVFKLQHLKDHIVCHSKLRMKCSACGKECRDAKVLKIHMNSHKPGQEKPFRCDFDGCSASFGTSALLSSHKRVHTGEKPHKCTWCDYRAADKGNLRRHEEEMHMGKKWPCPYCSQQLAKKANLTRHIRDLHASEEARRQTVEKVEIA